MKPLRWIAIGFLLTVPPGLCAKERVVGAGGGITEIVYALGQESRLVGVDSSSVYPEEATRLPQVGYVRALSAEGLLSLRPTLLIAYEEAGPPAILRQVENAGVGVLKVTSEPTVGDLKHRIEMIATALGVPERATPLIERVERDLENARASLENPPRVLFLYARSGGILNVSGAGTSADAMIRLAGGVNAVRGFEGFRPLTAEAAIRAAPEVILVTTRGLEDAGGMRALLQHPGLRQTPAAANRRVVAMDDLLLLGFGPRVGEAVKRLSDQLHHPERN